MKTKVKPPTLFRFCAYDQCGKQLPEFHFDRAGRKKRFPGIYCNQDCYGLSLRGKARGNRDKRAKNHIRIRTENGREYLHRHLFQTHVRPLQDGEIVHHIDDNKFHNAIDNFEALPSQSEHMKTHYRHKNGAYSKLIEDCPF